MAERDEKGSSKCWKLRGMYGFGIQRISERTLTTDYCVNVIDWQSVYMFICTCPTHRFRWLFFKIVFSRYDWMCAHHLSTIHTVAKYESCRVHTSLDFTSCDSTLLSITAIFYPTSHLTHEDWDLMATMLQTRFWNYFFKLKLLYIESLNSFPLSLINQIVSIGSGNGWGPRRRQAIIWTNGGVVYWRI